MLAALEDDLNTPEAVAELFGVVRATNRATDPAEKRALAESLRAGAWLLGYCAGPELVQRPADLASTSSGSGHSAQPPATTPRLTPW